MDRIELIEAYREIIKENIEYDLLVLRYGRERLDEALELMLEVILSKRPYIRIAGDVFSEGDRQEPVPEDQFRPLRVCL